MATPATAAAALPEPRGFLVRLVSNACEANGNQPFTLRLQQG
ncbi:hypothetical protein ACP70R_002753 [Stipagrostis hirtigluma subsp. patula]